MTAVALALGACARASQPGAIIPAANLESVSVQPGDRLFVHILGDARLLPDTVFVDARGNVPLPKVGVMHVADIPIVALRDSVQRRLAQFYRDPAVEVVALRRVAVNGEVQKPNVYYVDITTTLSDVIAQAGGVTDNGNPRDVSIIRGAREFPVPDWRRAQYVATQLQSGDQIMVGRRSWFEINALQIASLGLVVTSLIITLKK